MKNSIYANTSFKNRNPRHYQDKSCWWQFFWCVHHVSLNLAGCKVSHDFLQHHRHEWRHHHRHQHNQHAVHQLFQSNLFPRVCTTSAPPEPLAQLALPSSLDWDGLLPEDFRWPQLHNRMMTTFKTISYHLVFLFSSSSFWTIIIVPTGATLLLFAFRVLLVTMGSRSV